MIDVRAITVPRELWDATPVPSPRRSLCVHLGRVLRDADNKPRLAAPT